MERSRQIFTKPIQVEYENLKNNVKNISANSYSITHLTSDTQLNQLKSEIFDDFWQWDKLIIDEEPIEKDFQDVNLSHDQARELIGDFRWSMSSHTINAVKAFYVFKFSGSIGALDYTVNLPPRIMRCEIIGNLLKLIIYAQGDRPTVGKIAKDTKEFLLNSIKANQQALDSFLEEKKDEFKSLVSDAVQVAFEKAVQHNKDRDLL